MTQSFYSRVFSSLLEEVIFHGRPRNKITVSQLPMEAYYQAIVTTIGELLRLQILLSSVGVSLSNPTVLYCDNQVDLHFIANPYFTNELNIWRSTIILFVNSSSLMQFPTPKCLLDCNLLVNILL